MAHKQTSRLQFFQCSYVVYLNECTKVNCKENLYIGETKRHLRLADYWGYVVNNITTTTTGAHFNKPGHSVENMKITITEQIKKQSDLYRKEREEFLLGKSLSLIHI